MKKAAVMGASGRMGQEVMLALENSKILTFAAGVASGSKKFLEQPALMQSKDIDIVIDFSLPEGFSEILDWCVENKKPLVSGTTGLSVDHQKRLAQAATIVPVLWSPNMSVGVAVMTEMLKHFSVVKDFDFAIEELHHNQKKDSPSGTALHLKQNLEKALQKEVDQVVALRGGGIYGIHKVWAMSTQETITIEHTALNRAVFAAGAIRAAEWLVQKSPGQYRLSQVLGF
jgi:4-hydroxy-tetrahydrodipicolinate reductase